MWSNWQTADKQPPKDGQYIVALSCESDFKVLTMHWVSGQWVWSESGMRPLIQNQPVYWMKMPTHPDNGEIQVIKTHTFTPEENAVRLK